MKTLLRRALVAAVALLLLIQLVPYGRDHTNPPSGAEPKWDTPATRELAARACFDCHSNQTRWPWYSHVAPASWLLQRDVEEGREHLNFTEWEKPQRHADEAGEIVAEGEMPPWFYTPLHPSAALSAEERDALVRGLNATLGSRAGEREHGEDEGAGH
jgi:mono/diheme cytochrome c family protein